MSGGLSLFIASRFASLLADKILLFVAPLIIYTSTGSAALSGLAFAIEWIPRILSLPIGGSMSDHYGGGRVYRIADGVRAGACLVAALLTLHIPEACYLVVTVLMGVSAFFYAQAFIAMEATLPSLAGKKRLSSIQSLLQGVEQTSMLLGPAMAALLFSWLAPTDLLWVVGGLFGISTCLVWPYAKRTPKKAEAIDSRRFWSDFVLGAKFLFGEPILRRLLGFSITINLIVAVGVATGAALTIGEFHQPPAHYSYLQVSVGVLAIVTLALIPLLTKYVSLRKLGLSACGVIIAGGVLMASAETFPVFVAGFAMAVSGCSLYNVFIRTERVKWIPKQNLGKVISAMVFMSQLVLPLSGLIVAAYPPVFRLQNLFWIMSAIAAIYFLMNASRINNGEENLEMASEVEG